jgi:hypothetical protein
VIVFVCAAGFPLTTELGLGYHQREIVIGVCFFIASVGSMSFYFGQKAYLLLSGATLNAQFKIVRKREASSPVEDGSKTLFGSPSSAPMLPRSITECESQISLLQGHLMVLIEKAVNMGSASASQSGVGRSSKRPDLAGFNMMDSRESSCNMFEENGHESLRINTMMSPKKAYVKTGGECRTKYCMSY